MYILMCHAVFVVLSDMLCLLLCRPVLLDLIITFVPYLSHDSLFILFEFVETSLEVR